ncbi:hypothetical protein J2Z84_004710, partial [Agrobacterium rubi]|nr:hypothetical protein [Agrobacterium rubi]
MRSTQIGNKRRHFRDDLYFAAFLNHQLGMDSILSALGRRRLNRLPNRIKPAPTAVKPSIASAYK